jgi:UDP-N-acetylmuramate dehydrogenase
MLSYKENESLREKTSFRIGGPARYYVAPRNQHQVAEALAWAQRSGLAVLPLGKGSNILISDAGWRGLVIDLSAEFNRIQWDGTRAVGQCGALLHRLVYESVERGLAGCEELAGIPGTIGGAVIMNAGAFEQSVADTVVDVSVLDPRSASIARLTRNEITFEYRSTSIRKQGLFVLEASFAFTPGTTTRLHEVFAGILTRRRHKQPLDRPNCGSVFKRPPGGYAGTLLEQCGLKGFRIGEAMISEKHANFIVNLGNARADDVRAVIVHAQKTVHATTGILLEPEVIFAGEFAEPLYTADRPS